MKSIYLIALMLLLVSDITIAQVGINADGTQPHPSAMLDINSASRGLLPPRVTLSATNVAAPIDEPANGLLVYNTIVAGTAPFNVAPGYYLWEDTHWVPVSPPRGSSQ